MKTRLVLSVLAVMIAMGCSRAEKQPKPAQQPVETYGSIQRLDPTLDAIVPPHAKVERIATGFKLTEGPVWIHSGYLLFAAILHNSIMKWAPGEGVTTFLHPSGYQGKKSYPGRALGSNGMTLDKEGRLTVAGQGCRNVYRLESLEPGATLTVLADRYRGKRLNSPNDLVYRSDGSLYFTDPPYGLPAKGDHYLLKELPFSGVFRLPGATSIPASAHPANSRLQLLIRNLSDPNGLAFSPDENYLYVDDSDSKHMVWMRYDVKPDGTVTNGAVFCRADPSDGPGGPDGIKVDEKGNLYGAGPGGLWIISPAGKHLGTIKLPEGVENCGWGGADGKTLYITATSSVYRIRLKIPGIMP